MKKKPPPYKKEYTDANIDQKKEIEASATLLGIIWIIVFAGIGVGITALGIPVVYVITLPHTAQQHAIVLGLFLFFSIFAFFLWRYIYKLFKRYRSLKEEVGE